MSGDYLTIKEAIAKKKVSIKQAIVNRKANEEKRKILKAQQEALKKQKREEQKVIRAARREERNKHLVNIRDVVFDNCCEVLKECNGLDVDINFKRPKYLHKFNLKGTVKFSKKDMDETDRVKPTNERIALLKVRSVIIAEILVSFYNGTRQNFPLIKVSLYTYSPRNFVYDVHDAKRMNKKDVLVYDSYTNGNLPSSKFIKQEIIPTEFTTKDCSFLRKQLVSYFVKIITDEDLSKETKKIVKKSSKKIEKDEPVTSEYQFIDLDE